MRRLLSGMLSLIMVFGCFSGIAISSKATENVHSEAEYTAAETNEETPLPEAATKVTTSPVAAKAATKAVPAGLKYSVSNGKVTITDYTGSATELVIPKTIDGYPVTRIGDSAFYGCTSLTSVTIPDSVTSIGYRAFYNCDSLTSVTIPDSVTSIGDSVFSSCYSLTSITIPDSVTSIGEYAFEGCSKLTSITIPDSVTSIGNNAFYYCTSLTNITIPDSVTSIGDSAFQSCDNLTGVYISDISAWCTINFKGYYANPLWYANNLYLNGNLVTDLVIPDSVTSIGEHAFYNCDSLTSVTIPDSVTSIGSSAFEDCSSLTSVTIPDSVTSIGSAAFFNCDSLTSITIPDSVTSIGGSAFKSCDSLTSVTIPDSVTSIGYSAFYDCTSLTSITIPDSVTSIGNQAFYNCNSLTSVTIGDSVTSIGNSAFSHCSSLTSITIPDSVTSIGNHAFRDCDSLTSVTIPNSVTSIGSSAFRDCDSLTSITIPDSITYIGDDAFYRCSSLNHVLYAGTQEQWNLIEVGNGNSSLTGTKVFHYGGGEVYWTKNCVNVGLYCTACDDFLTREREDDGTHTFTDDADLACNDCDYIRPIRTISIDQLPAQLEYTYCKDTLDVSGGVLLLTYSGGVSIKMDMTPDMVSGFDNTVPGTQVLTVTVEGCKTSYPVTIVLGEPESLTVDSLPQKLSYLAGESLDLTGLSVIAHYTNDYTEELSLADLNVSAVDMHSSGIKTVTVSYQGVSASFDICVHALDSITVDRLPDKLSYLAGDSLDLTGLSVTAHYTYNYTEELSLADLNVSAVDMHSSGVKTVTVSYQGVSTSFDIYVHTKGLITADSSLYPESSHNYASNTDETKVFTYPYAEQLVLTFNSSSYTESNYDFLYVLDGDGNQIGKYSGSLAGKVVTVPGDTVQLRLVSDSSVNKYGYAFTSIVAAVMEYTRQEVSGYAPTLTAPGLTDGVICQCCGMVLEAQQEIPKLEGSVAQWNLSLADDWKANFHLQISDSIVPSAQVQILVGEYLHSFPVKELQKTEDGFYLVSVGVAAAQMNDTISVQVINGEDCGEVYTYTVRQYCDTLLADSQQSQYHPLVKEMLSYGAMAQIYFDYDADNLANDGITGTALADVPETADEMTLSDNVSKLNLYGASLVYRDRIAVRYYFAGDVTGCTFTANGNTYTPVAKDAMHYIEIADILPQNLDQQLLLTVTDAAGNTLSVTYSPMNYIVRMHAKGSMNLKNLLKALYNYHLAAKAL